MLTAHHLERGWVALAPLLLVATALELAAGAGLAYVAGFTRVLVVLTHFRWPWLWLLPAAWLVSLVGYYFAYRGIFAVESGHALKLRHLIPVVIAGFGGFLAYRGQSLEQQALQAAGTDKAEAQVRVASLSGLEQGILGISGCGLSIAMLAAHDRVPPVSVTAVWAIVPIPAGLLAFWVARRYRNKFPLGRDSGWKARLGTFLHSIHVIREMFTHPLRWGPAIIGMALFWAADALAAWAGLAAFGFGMNVAALFLGFASGMLFTRRTGPLAGAGILALMLPLTISYCGAPLAVAVAGVFVYRILSLWLPMPAWLAAIPALRRLCMQPQQPLHRLADVLPQAAAAVAAVAAVAPTPVPEPGAIG
jgi:uncharacterized membrane protein YbhN (UPF0104 family)